MNNIEKYVMPCLVFLSVIKIFLFLSPCASAGENRISYSIPRVTLRPNIDGVIDEGEWEGALRVSLDNETEPSQNIPAIVDTDVLLMEDGVNFYIAFIAHDPNPVGIRAFYRDRNAGRNDDRVGIVIDTFNDERRAFQFFANALGVQIDGIRDDVARRDDWSWNALWESAGKINDSGYVVEMAIPLNEIRFPGGLDIQTWGIDLVRYYPRDRNHRFSNNTRDYDVTCYLCQLKKAQGFSELEPSLNLRFVPTLTATYSESRPDPNTDEWQGTSDIDAGMDIRWGINQNFYLNATINPDFSQVEADSIQIDINRMFSLFFPERREFFLEGAEYFNTHMNAVYTRNISSPDFGIKLTGKQGAHSIGMYFTDDDTTNFLIPGVHRSFVASLKNEKSINSVIRYRRDISRNINIGTVFTDRRSSDYSNTVAGIDGNIQIGRSDRVVMQVMKSYSEYPETIQNIYGQSPKIDDYAYLIDYSHNDNRWSWRTRYERYGNDFRADMGFINRVGYRKTDIRGGHTWRFGPGQAFSRIFLEGRYDKVHDDDGKRLEEFFDISISGNSIMQSFMVLGYNRGERFFNGRYFDEYEFRFFTRLRPRTTIDMSLDINYGDSIDYVNTRLGRRLSVTPWLVLHVGDHLQTNLRYNFQRMEIDGEELYSTGVYELRFTYQFNLRSFIRLAVQHSDTKFNQSLYLVERDSRSRNMSSQLLYSYRINPLTRFFIGYSDTGFQNDDMSGIKRTNRTLFSKISYAF